MKIAIIADTHLGYARFEEDAFVQAERAFLDASEKADLILFAGDVFDIKVPKLETIDRAISIFKKIKIPVYAIHGNHERRAKELTNPAKLLDTSGVVNYLHCTNKTFEKNGVRIQVFGVGNVPDEYAQEAVKKATERFVPEQGAFKVLLIHQTIKELVPHGNNELSLDYLETLPFDLVVNGHIHGKEIRMGGRFLIPGSTVITQLRKEETDPRGYFLFDTETKNSDFIPINCRPFFYVDIELNEAGPSQVLEAVEKKVQELRKESPNALIALKVKGSLKEGISTSDIRLPNYPHVFLDNLLDESSLNKKLERIRDLRSAKLSVRDLAQAELEEKTKGKITSFDPVGLFDKLVEGTEATIEYIERNDKGDQNGKVTIGS